MVAWLLTVTLASILAVASAFAVPGRQLCLSCHSVHHAGLGSCTACHRGNPASERKNIAHQQLIAGRYARFTLADDQQLRAGNRLLEQYACRRCHVIGGKGNRLSVNLDYSTGHRSPEELAASIRQPVQNMPDFRLEETQATLLVNALLSAASRQPVTSGRRPQVVHFDQVSEAGQDVFSKKCGPCHRMLTGRLGGLGGLGRGNSGPNLSGLLTTYYPKSFRISEAWTIQSLNSWLKNPRAIQPWARMRPIELTGDETKELATIFQVAPDPKR